MKTPLTIAYIVHTFEPGGLERCVSRIVSNIDRQLFSPIIVCLNRNGRASEWIDTRDVPIVELHKRDRNDFGLLGRFAKVLEENQVDVAHSHNWGTLVETAIACRMSRRRTRHIHAERGTVLGPPTGSSLRKWLRSYVMGLALNRADVVISNAKETAERVGVVSRYPSSRVQVIPNGVAAPITDFARRSSERDRIRRMLNADGDTILLGSVGRLAAVKNLETAICATAEVLKEGVPVKLLLVGDGPEREKLCEIAARNAISDQVHFMGEQLEAGPWYAAMDVFVNSSLSEGMSQSVVEAMSMGLPLVATDVGDHRRVVEANGGCGFIVERRNVGALADAFRRIAGDRELRKVFGERSASLHSAEYSLDAMIDRYQELYRSIAKSVASPKVLPALNIISESRRPQKIGTERKVAVP